MPFSESYLEIPHKIMEDFKYNERCFPSRGRVSKQVSETAREMEKVLNSKLLLRQNRSWLMSGRKSIQDKVESGSWVRGRSVWS